MTDRPHENPGDRIGRLYDRFAAALYRYALMILADPAAAADVVQQVFVALLRSSNSGIESDERYLRRAVRNECYTTLRRRTRTPVEAVDRDFIEAIAGAEAPSEERLAVQQAMRALPPEQREVVHMKVFEGMTFQEIADTTDEPLNTVASRYRYALEKLRAFLKQDVT